MTIEADERHVREMLKDLDLEHANPAATPCNQCEQEEREHRRK